MAGERRMILGDLFVADLEEISTTDYIVEGE